MIELLQAMQIDFKLAFLEGYYPLPKWPKVLGAIYVGSGNLKVTIRIWYN